MKYVELRAILPDKLKYDFGAIIFDRDPGLTKYESGSGSRSFENYGSGSRLFKIQNNRIRADPESCFLGQTNFFLLNEQTRINIFEQVW